MKWTLAFLLIIVACAPVGPQEQQHVTDTMPEPQADVDAPEPAPPEPVAAPAPVIEERTVNPEVTALSKRASQIKGYKFNLASLPKKSGGDTYYVHGDKIKIKLVQPFDIANWGSADYIYIDRATSIATAWCIKLGDCEMNEKSHVASFDTWNPVLPLDWLDELQYGEIDRKLQFNERPVTTIIWEQDGRYYEAYLDDFYGVPQRVAIATDEDMTQIVGGQEYQFLETNAVSEEEVEAPN